MRSAAMIMPILCSLLLATACGSPPAPVGQPTSQLAPVLILGLQIDGLTPGIAHIGEGAVLKITKDGGPTIGLLATFRDEEHIVVKVMEIAKPSLSAPEEEQRVLFETTVTLAMPAISVLAGPYSLNLRWAGVDPAPSNTLESGPCTKCCVSCSGYTVCGCRIQLDCGACCCSDTCNCDGIDEASRSGRKGLSSRIKKSVGQWHATHQ
jgi:hypothetical protein